MVVASEPAALQIGINLDGVLVHDGLSTPQAQTRMAWVKHSGAFDYIEKNIDPTEDFAPYFQWVEQHGVPIRAVFEALASALISTAWKTPREA